MTRTEGFMDDDIFHLTKTYSYADTDDMAEFERLMCGSKELVIAVNYRDTHVEALMQPGW